MTLVLIGVLVFIYRVCVNIYLWIFPTMEQAIQCIDRKSEDKHILYNHIHI